MSSSRLDEARAAAAELRRLQELSGELPALEAEAVNRERIEACRARATRTEAAAVQAVEAARPAIVSWRDAFQVWAEEGAALAGRLAELEAPLCAALDNAQEAAVRLAQAEAWAQGGNANSVRLYQADAEGAGLALLARLDVRGLDAFPAARDAWVVRLRDLLRERVGRVFGAERAG